MTLSSSAQDERPEAWLQHLDWIRRLAVRLARDEAAADDLVQRTALVALKRSEALRAASQSGGVRGWLRGILHNEARAGWRSERNRSAREQDHAAARLPLQLEPGEAEERLGLTKRVVAAVEQLEEPYRSVILARYFDGRGVGQIALALSIPVRTVETRLRRGREKLRAELSRHETSGGVSGSGASWAALALVSWGNASMLPGAAAVAGTSTGTFAGASTSLFPWLALMNIKALLLGTAVLVALVIGVHRWVSPQAQLGAPSGSVLRTSSLEAPMQLAPVSESAMVRAVVPQATKPAPFEVAPPEKSHLDDLGVLPVGTLDVWVVDEDDLPIEGARITLVQGSEMFSGWAPPKVPEDSARLERVVPSQNPDAAPEPVRFEGLAIDKWYVEVSTPKGSVRISSARLGSKEGKSHIVRFGSAVVFGSVVDPAAGRQPIPGAYLTLAGQHVLTDGQGRYRFEEISAGSSKLWLYPGIYDEATDQYLQIARRFVTLRVERDAELRIDFPPALESGGAVLRGRIVDAGGEDVRTPSFMFRRAEVSVKTRPGQGVESPAVISMEQRTTYSLDGTFEMSLPSGSYDVTVKSPNLGKSIAMTEATALELPPGEVTTVQFTIPGITLHGQLPEGVMGASIGDVQRRVSARLGHTSGSYGIYRGFADDTGAFKIFGLEPGDWIISGAHGGYEAQLTIREGDRSASVQLREKEE